MTASSSLFDLTGRVAIVTGGNRGIGHAMALGLARAGASVAVLARNAEQNQLVLAELKAIGKPALVLPLDVTDRTALAPAVAEVERTLGGVDILINNAGIVALTGGVLNETADIWDKTIETHLNAAFLLSQIVANQWSSVRAVERSSTSPVCTRYSDLGSCPPIAQPRALSFS